MHAFNAGFERVKSLDFDVVGNLDADITFGPDYLDFLMRMFADDPKLGVAGTPFVEDSGYDSAKDSFEGENYVAGGCQMFRAECFREIGGYIPNPGGGVDWIAVMSARMKGWKVRSFAEKRFHHHRTLGTAETSPLGAAFAYGERAYFLGGSPALALRSQRLPDAEEASPHPPAWRCCQVTSWAALRRMKRPVSPEMMRFHRRDQYAKAQGHFRPGAALQEN